MIGLIELLAITSVLQMIVAGKLFKIEDIRTCTEYCFSNGNIGNFKDRNCVCENLDNTDAENAIRENKKAEYIDSDFNELTNEDRTIRCILKSRKHMRHNDGDRIVRYFVNDGPANGHAYFVQEASQGMNPDEFNSQTSDEQPSIANSQQSYGDAIVGAPYDQYNPIYFLPKEKPVVTSPYNTVIEPKSNKLSSRRSSLNNLMDSKLLPKLLPRYRSRSNNVQRFSDALHETIRPVNDHLLGSSPNNLIHQNPAEYSFNYNNNKNDVNENDIENETKEVDSIVESTNEDEKTPTVNSKTSLQENIPYNQQYLMSIYPLQYLVENGLYNTMSEAYILQPVNIMLEYIPWNNEK